MRRHIVIARLFLSPSLALSLSLCVCMWASVCVLFSFRLFFAYIFNEIQCYVAVLPFCAHMATIADSIKMCIVKCLYVYQALHDTNKKQEQQQQRQMYTIFFLKRLSQSQNICFVVRAFTTSQASQVSLSHFFVHADFLISFFWIRGFFLLHSTDSSEFVFSFLFATVSRQLLYVLNLDAKKASRTRPSPINITVKCLYIYI